MKRVLMWLAVFAGIGLFVWNEIEARERHAETVRSINAIADTFTARIDTLNSTIEERGRQVEGPREVERALAESNALLAHRLREADALLLTHGETIAVLSDSVSGLRVESERTAEGTDRFPILWHREFDQENFFKVEGSLDVLPGDPPQGIVDLALTASLSLDVVVSRTPAPELALRCDAASGMPGVVTLTKLDCIDNLSDPLRPPRSFALDMFKPPALVLGVVGLATGYFLANRP